jgi:hypothetical protein
LQRNTPDTTFFWLDAIDYCENLEIDGAADWRLPSIKELQTIVDESTTNPALDTMTFGDISSETNFCSSSISIRVFLGLNSGEDFNFTSAWNVDFDDGHSGLGYTFYEIGRPRCVR